MYQLINKENRNENEIELYSYNLNNLNINIGKIQGNRTNMEDFYIIENYYDLTIIGIFDGHGGTSISQHIYKEFNPINKLIYNYYSNIITYKILIQSLKKKFIKLDKLFINYKDQGSTISILYISNKTIYHINLGDSKMIYIYNNNIVYENEIHRPTIPSERKRILKTSYIINNRINNKLSLSRSIGDYNYKFINNKYDGIKSAVSCIPSFKTITIKNNSYSILSTDGLWDYVNYKDIIKIINLDQSIKSCINKLILHAIKNGSNDNIILILLKL